MRHAIVSLAIALIPAGASAACGALKDGSEQPVIDASEAGGDASPSTDDGASDAADIGSDAPRFPARPLGPGVGLYAITPLGGNGTPTLWTLPYLAASQAWHAIQEVPDAASAPTSVSWTRMHTEVFYTTSAGTLARLYTDDFGQTYHGIEDWGALTGYTLVGRPDATSWAEGRIDVVCFAQPRGGGGTVLAHAAYDSSAVTWESWDWPPAAVDGGTLTPGSNPTATSWSEGNLDVFFIGSDQQLWNRYIDVPAQPAPRPWYAFSNDGQTLGDNLDGVSRTDGMVDLQTMSPDHMIVQWWWGGMWRLYLDGMPALPSGSAVHLGPLSLAKTGTDGYVIAGVDDLSPPSVWTQLERMAVHPPWSTVPAPPAMPANGVVEATAW
jgi:hypothetical protein